MTQLRRVLIVLRCCLQGHDDVLSIDKGRVYLTCTTCQRESAGWSVA